MNALSVALIVVLSSATWAYEYDAGGNRSATVTVGHETTHLKGIHGRGLAERPGEWNKRWSAFIDENPNATATEVYQFGGRLMDEYGLSGLPLHGYRKP